jgi:phasin
VGSGKVPRPVIRPRPPLPRQATPFPRETAMQDTATFPEFPDSIRNIMKSSIEQAKKAFDTFASTNENMMQNVDVSPFPAGDTLKALNEKIAAFTRQNAEANFNHALRLTDAKQMSEIVELQNTHLREQMETYGRQMEELREITMKAVKEAARAASEAVQAPLHAAQAAVHQG